MLFSQEIIFQFIVLVILFYLLSPGTWDKITKDSQEKTTLINAIIFAVLFLLISKFIAGDN